MDRPPLVCNCTRLIFRGGEKLLARSWRWDCPSCGLDKRRALVAAAELVDARRIVTATFPQPHFQDSLGLPTRPRGYEKCDLETHVYRYKDGTLRWQTVPSCDHCLTRVSEALTLLRKRLRTRWPSIEYAKVYEQHKSGAVHIHMCVVGIPEKIVNNSVGGRKMRSAWFEITGGRLDVGYSNRKEDGARRAGSYCAKYVTKAMGMPIAKGYRRWSRTRGFGTEIPIPGPRRLPQRPNVILPMVLLGGWVDPFSGDLREFRVWVSPGSGATPLVPRSCNCPTNPGPHPLGALVELPGLPMANSEV